MWEQGGNLAILVGSSGSKVYNQLIHLWLYAFHSAVAKITKITLQMILHHLVNWSTIWWSKPCPQQCVERGALYCIVENFRGRKLSRIGENMIFVEKTFVNFSLLPHQKCHAPKFAEKTFVNSHKTVKSAKVFSLESFPLYSTCLLYKHNCIQRCS